MENKNLNIAIESAKKLGFNNSKVDENKLIHFCWFGRSVFSELNLQCMESWKKYMNDYTFCLWDEASFDINTNDFVKGAYDSKKWAFVSDFVRLWAVYNYGGMYFDTDVEILKPLNDLPSNFLAIEEGYHIIALGLGFAADKGNGVIRDLLNIYEFLKFDKNHLSPITIPHIVTGYFWDNGYKSNMHKIHNFLGFTIYPPEYFCPKSHLFRETNITDNTLTIHHYEGSWLFE